MKFINYSPDTIADALMCCLGKHKEIDQSMFSPDYVLSIQCAIGDMRNKIEENSLSDNYKILYDLLNKITAFEKCW